MGVRRDEQSSHPKNKVRAGRTPRKKSLCLFYLTRNALLKGRAPALRNFHVSLSIPNLIGEYASRGECRDNHCHGYPMIRALHAINPYEIG